MFLNDFTLLLLLFFRNYFLMKIILKVIINKWLKEKEKLSLANWKFLVSIVIKLIYIKFQICWRIIFVFVSLIEDILLKKKKKKDLWMLSVKYICTLNTYLKFTQLEKVLFLLLLLSSLISI